MKLSFYSITSDYTDFLRKTDSCVPYTMDSKASRPFIGIVLSINEFNYYAPLTSPKAKHLKMKNQLDFIKINEGVFGAINLNNMIPVPMDILKKIEIQILLTDTETDIEYKNLLVNQLSWCNTNCHIILAQAVKLYVAITMGRARLDLARRCCNFTVNEEQLRIYCKTMAHSKDKLSIKGE